MLGRCSRQMCKSCAGVNMAYSREERVSILVHYCASKSSAAVREAFSSACPDKEEQNEVKMHQRVTNFGWLLVFENLVDIFSICCKFFLTNKN
jgi:hypothetical protein